MGRPESFPSRSPEEKEQTKLPESSESLSLDTRPEETKKDTSLGDPDDAWTIPANINSESERKLINPINWDE